MRTDEEILREMESRFAVNTTVRSLPLHMASPPPKHDRKQKVSASIGLTWAGRKKRHGKDGQFKSTPPLV